MAENEVNITDMIKALQCVASQDADGDCYCDHFNAHLTCEQFGDNTRLDENHMSCGGVLKDTQSCPYSQKTYGVCCEDGELWWLKDVVSILTEIQQYRAIGTVEELKLLQLQNHLGRDESLVAGRKEGYNKAIDEFTSTLIPRLTDAIYQKDVESMTNLINEIAEQLKSDESRWCQ